MSSSWIDPDHYVVSFLISCNILYFNAVKAETPIFWPPHAKSWLIGKDPDAGRDWGQEEKGTTEDEMAGWHHRLDGREFEWTPGVGDGQGGLGCCDSWRHKESDTTERLNWTKVYFVWYENCYSSFLLLPICMENIFPSSHFQSICVLRSEVDFL